MFEYPEARPELQVFLNRIREKWQKVRSEKRPFYQYTDDALTYVQLEIDSITSYNEYATSLLTTQMLERIEKDHIDKELSFIDVLDETHARQIKYVTMFAPQLTNEEYWDYLRAVYNSGYFIEGSCFEELSGLFFTDRPNRELLMNEKERAIFEALPEELYAYSPEITKHNDETSKATNRFFRRWVIHRKDAIKHAQAMMLQLYKVECKIIKKSIQKSQIIACFSSYYGIEILHQKPDGELQVYVNRVDLFYSKREHPLSYYRKDQINKTEYWEFLEEFDWDFMEKVAF